MKKVGNCDVCEKPVLPTEDYQEGFFGELAHTACLETVSNDEEDEDGR